MNVTTKRIKTDLEKNLSIKSAKVIKASNNFIFVVGGMLRGRPFYATVCVDTQKCYVTVAETKGVDYKSLGDSIAYITTKEEEHALVNVLKEKIENEKKEKKHSNIQWPLGLEEKIIDNYRKKVLGAIDTHQLTEETVEFFKQK